MAVAMRAMVIVAMRTVVVSMVSMLAVRMGGRVGTGPVSYTHLTLPTKA